MKMREELIAQVLRRVDVRPGSEFWTAVSAHVWHVFNVEHTDMPKGLWNDVVSRAFWLTTCKRPPHVRVAACRAFASVLHDFKTDARLSEVPGVRKATRKLTEWAYYPDVISANVLDDAGNTKGITKWCGS